MKWGGNEGESVWPLAILVGMVVLMLRFPQVCILVWVMLALILLAGVLR